jgi:hypothetical protein
MKFEDAIAKSVEAFLSGKTPDNLAGLKEDGLKYTQEYFDNFEKELASTKSRETKDEK